jgi:hypothetical protein
VIVAYEEEDVGLEAMREAAELVRACLAGGDAYAGLRRRGGRARLVRLHERVRLGPSDAPRSSRRRGGAASPCGASTRARSCQLGLGRHLRRIQATSPTSRA